MTEQAEVPDTAPTKEQDVDPVIRKTEVPEIEENIPIPPKDRESVTAKQIAELQIGHSRLYKELALRQVQAQAAYVRRKYSRKFAVRDTGDGIRVWRVS